MKVALDVSPLKSGHQFRGVGFYTRNLAEAFKKLERRNFSAELVEGKLPLDCDIVHYPYFDFFFLTLPMAKKRPTVVTIHDCTPLVFPKYYPPGIKGNIKLTIQKLSLNNVKRIITDSENSKKDIIKFLNVPEEKIKVIYLAAGNMVRRITDQSTLSKISIKYKLPKKFVLYTGDVNYNKNLIGLVKACRLVKITLVIVGKQAAEENFEFENKENQPLKELNKLIEEEKDVLRLGFVNEEDLSSLYSLASVYCQPSFYEGFGLCILEAMICGCPVVTSNISSLPELTGGAAILVNPQNYEEIARGIKQVIEDKKIQDKMIMAGFKQAAKFTWRKTAIETVKVYEEVLAK